MGVGTLFTVIPLKISVYPTVAKLLWAYAKKSLKELSCFTKRFSASTLRRILSIRKVRTLHNCKTIFHTNTDQKTENHWYIRISELRNIQYWLVIWNPRSSNRSFIKLKMSVALLTFWKAQKKGLNSHFER